MAKQTKTSKSISNEITADEFALIQQETKRDPVNKLKYAIKHLNVGVAKRDDEGNFIMDVLPDGKLHTLVVDSDVVFNWDLQPRDVTDGTHLIEDIMNRGLVTEPTAWVNGDSVEVLMGHLRMDALARMQALYPEEFKGLFPKGVPVKVYQDLTEEQAMLIRDDHDLDNLKRKLQGRVEVFHLLRPKFEKLWTEAQILKADWRTLASVLSGNYSALEKKVADETDQRKQYDIIFKSQKGNLQNLKAVYRNPIALQEYWMDAERGNKAKLKQETIRELATLFENEQSEGEKMQPMQKFTKVKPGPQWVAAFAEARQEAETPRAEKRKPLTTKAREDLRKDLNSNVATFAMLAVENEQEYAVEQLKKVDKVIAPIESAYQVDSKALDVLVVHLNKTNEALTPSQISNLKKLLKD